MISLQSGDPFDPPTRLPSGMLSRYPWLTFLLPLLVFMLVGGLEPTPPSSDEPNSNWAWIEYQHYPAIYSSKIALTVLAMIGVLAGYKTFPFRLRPLPLLVGVVGAVAWVGICKSGLEEKLLGGLGIEMFAKLGERSGFNPLQEIANPGFAYGFLLIRFFGLAVVVAIVEEFFLRGFLMRYFVDEDWWKVPFGKVNTKAILAGTLVPMLMHPGELFAAMVWFSVITWLMIRTRNIWDCVLAHATTNLMLGIYVVVSGDWWLM